MLENMKFKSDNGSGSLAAAYLIFSVGLVGATLFIGLSFREYPLMPVLVLIGGGFAALLTIVLRSRPQLPSQTLWLFTRARRAGEWDYAPKLIKSQPPTTFGTNRPPTADDIRELKENPIYWVPSRSRSNRSSLKR